MKSQSQQPPGANPAARAGQQPLKQVGQDVNATTMPQPASSGTWAPNNWVSGGFDSPGSNAAPAPSAASPSLPAAPATQGQYLGDLNGQPTYGGGQPSGSVTGQTRPLQVSGPGAPGRDPTAPMNTDLGQYGPTVNSVPTSNVPGLVGGDALKGAMTDAQHAAYSIATGYLDPQWTNDQKALESKLINQGVTQNSEAWNRAMDDFGRQKEFAYSQARSGAVSQGNAAQAQLFNQGLTSHATQFGENVTGANLTNAAQAQRANQGFTQQNITNTEAQRRFDDSITGRNQQINELLLQQKNPLDMASAATNGSQVTQPNFTSAPGATSANTDLLAAIQQAYGGQLNAYNAQTGAANSSNSGMAAIIAALICDRRLKKNIRRIGMHKLGIPLYAFDYLWDEPGVGVMADELAQIKPEAVHTLKCGYKYIVL
jgi:hypothetical protein